MQDMDKIIDELTLMLLYLTSWQECPTAVSYTHLDVYKRQYILSVISIPHSTTAPPPISRDGIVHITESIFK